MLCDIANGGPPGILYEYLVACAYYGVIAACIAEVSSCFFWGALLLSPLRAQRVLVKKAVKVETSSDLLLFLRGMVYSVCACVRWLVVIAIRTRTYRSL